MTIDERLAALAQTLELMAALQKDHEANTARRMATMSDAITRLAHIAEVQ